MKKVIIGLMSTMALLMVGCSSGPKPTTTLDGLLENQTARDREIKSLNDQLFASFGGTPQYQDYILGQGDLIEVKVFEAKELNTEVRVGARGFITLPLLGPVPVTGLTAQEAEQKIEDLYREKYLQDPHVNIFVKEQFGNKITVLGSVNNPGTYDYPSRQNLLDVLAMAGGLSKEAGWMVQVRRSSEETELPAKFLVDLNQLVKEGKAELNLPIRGDDVIYVPEAGVIYVDGAVQRPGNYPIKGGMTIKEAVVAAGGYSDMADKNHIKLVRLTDKDHREVIELRQEDIQSGIATNLEVKDRDVVFVETSTMRALMYGLQMNIAGGLFGIGYDPRYSRRGY